MFTMRLIDGKTVLCPRNMRSVVPWKDLAGFRDKLIHQYFGVDMSMVWRSVVDDVPMLLEELSKVQMSESKA